MKQQATQKTSRCFSFPFHNKLPTYLGVFSCVSIFLSSNRLARGKERRIPQRFFSGFFSPTTDALVSIVEGRRDRHSSVLQRRLTLSGSCCWAASRRVAIRSLWNGDHVCEARFQRLYRRYGRSSMSAGRNHFCIPTNSARPLRAVAPRTRDHVEPSS